MVKPDAVTRREAEESFACLSGDWGTVTQGVVWNMWKFTSAFFTLRITPYCWGNLRHQNFCEEQSGLLKILHPNIPERAIPPILNIFPRTEITLVLVCGFGYKFFVMCPFL